MRSAATRRTLGWPSMGLLTALSLAPLSGCNRGREENGERSATRTHAELSDQAIKTFRYSLRDDLKTFDPVAAADTVTSTVIPQIVEGLYQYAYLKRPFRIEPLLAADMPKFSKDRLMITIPIRRGVRYADDPCFENGKGRELKAQDFVTAFRRHLHPLLQSLGLWAMEGRIQGVDAALAELRKTEASAIKNRLAQVTFGVEATDDYTLVIRLVRPYPQILQALALPLFAPIPQELIDKYGDENGGLLDHLVGTGPFKLVSWHRGHKIILEKNLNFHPDFYPTDGDEAFRKLGYLKDAGKPLPLVERLIFEITREEQPAWLRFLKGEFDAFALVKDSLDLALNHEGKLQPELSSKDFKLIEEASLRYYFLQFNMSDPLYGKNKYLRQAISAAMDRDLFIKTLTSGRGLRLHTMIPAGVDGHDASIRTRYDYAPEKAKELLVKAGYPGGKGLAPLKLEMRGADTFARQIGDFVRQQLQAVGIQVEVTLNSFPAFLEKQRRGQVGFCYGGWQLDYPDPESALLTLYGPNRNPGPNSSNFDHPEYNRLYERMARLEPGPERTALIKKMDAIFQEEAPWALLYQYRYFGVAGARTRNFNPMEQVDNRFKYFGLN